MRICPFRGIVKISAPLRTATVVIQQFVVMHIQWIQKHLSAHKMLPPERAYTYSTGERHLFQGSEYILRVHEVGKKAQTVITDGMFIDMYLADDATQSLRESQLIHFYRRQLLSQLETLIPHWEEKIGVSVASYQVRRMKSRWGSCHPVKRHVSFNLLLIKYPKICLEYVIVHELVHLLEASHNARFKALMSTFMPDWRAYKLLLDN